MYRSAYLLGLLAYVCVVALSVLFYKERIIFLDTADYLFYVIQSGHFWLVASRFGSCVSQLLPLLAIKGGATLDHVILCFSLDYTLFYLFCYLACGLWLRQYDMALVLLFFHTLFVTHTFYYVPSELSPGVNFLFLLLAWIRSRNLSWPPVHIVAICIGSAIAAFFHPLLSFVLVYTLLYFSLRRDIYTNKKIFIPVAISFVAGLAIKTIFFSIPYDRQAASGMKHFITLFPHYIDLYSNIYLLKSCLTIYYWIPMLIIAVVAVYTLKKEWKKMALFVLAVFGYMLLVNVSYPDEKTSALYFENVYLPLGVFLALPLVFDVLPLLARRKLALPLVALILVSGIVRMYHTHEIYTTRLNYERDLLHSYGNRKVILRATDNDVKALTMIWGTPYEFWLLSTIEQGNTASIIIDADPAYRSWAAGIHNKLVVNWNSFAYTELDPRYFHFTDTTTGYTIIK